MVVNKFCTNNNNNNNFFVILQDIHMIFMAYERGAYDLKIITD